MADGIETAIQGAGVDDDFEGLDDWLEEILVGRPLVEIMAGVSEVRFNLLVPERPEFVEGFVRPADSLATHRLTHSRRPFAAGCGNSKTPIFVAVCYCDSK